MKKKWKMPEWLKATSLAAGFAWLFDNAQKGAAAVQAVQAIKPDKVRRKEGRTEFDSYVSGLPGYVTNWPTVLPYVDDNGAVGKQLVYPNNAKGPKFLTKLEVRRIKDLHELALERAEGEGLRHRIRRIYSTIVRHHVDDALTPEHIRNILMGRVVDFYDIDPKDEKGKAQKDEAGNVVVFDDDKAWLIIRKRVLNRQDSEVLSFMDKRKRQQPNQPAETDEERRRRRNRGAMAR